MYRTFYSLSGEPFSKEIAPGDYFPSRNWSEVKARLQYLVRTRGIEVLVGRSSNRSSSGTRREAILSPMLTGIPIIYLPENGFKEEEQGLWLFW